MRNHKKDWRREKFWNFELPIAIVFFVVAIPIGLISWQDWTGTPIINHSQLKQIKKEHIMRQCTIKFPKSKTKEVAKFLAENAIITNLSWMETDGFFDQQMYAIIAFPDDKEDKVKANLTKYIKE